MGIESKFTEWTTPKRDCAASLAPYLSKDESYWSRARLPGAHSLACDMAAGRETFVYLDAPQLLKHALGLAAAPVAAQGWQLRYVYFDAAGPEQAEHARELARFQEAVGAELRFCALTYQTLVAALGPARDAEEAAYLDYVRDRYVQAVPAE